MDEGIADVAGELGRVWLPGNRGIDSADPTVAAAAIALDARQFTVDVRHFPVFSGLSAPY